VDCCFPSTRTSTPASAACVPASVTIPLMIPSWASPLLPRVSKKTNNANILFMTSKFCQGMQKKTNFHKREKKINFQQKMSNRTLSKQKHLADEDLLKLYLQDGDLNHLGDLYQKHSEMVYYVCLRYFKETERSKDAVMQIFEELIDKVKRQDIQDFPRWL